MSDPQTLSPAGFHALQKFEGCKLLAYQDEAGVWTIGYGHTGREVKRGLRWTQEQADLCLAHDVMRFEADVRMLLGHQATYQHKFDALVLFAFNCGSDIDSDTKAEGLGDSSLLKFHLLGLYERAAEQFPKWVHAGGHISKGLVSRRAAEKRIYEKGIYPA